MSVLIAGIDPGVNTRVAIWDRRKRMFVVVHTYDKSDYGIIAALGELSKWVASGRLEEIHVEDARLRTWFEEPKNSKERIKKLQGAGSVKRDCAIWQQFCAYKNIVYKAVHPKEVYARFPLPSGMNKWNAEYFMKMTGWPGRTSVHSRDAAALVWNV